MQFASLGSGSKGNSSLVRRLDTLLMIDCGYSLKQTLLRLASLLVEPADIQAIVVTHEHSDHISGVARLSKKYQIPVWMSHGTYRACQGAKFDTDFFQIHCFHPEEVIRIGAINIAPFAVPHDAREPCQLVLHAAGKQLGILTDTGSITPHIIASLSDCDALMLECNYDAAMLANGPYPEALKQRVGGRLGHLSNQQAADLLAQIQSDRLKTVVLSHISEKNNTAEKARLAIEAVMGQQQLHVADQLKGFDWIAIEN
ncbi:MAG: MBL fold metallo-hydrolase [Gammaproteobacteria bacterium]|nr:MBL fold metallo-hydrolase [Gammaproteobacteria bacterium]